jgi:S1-C subfamily serine protease
VARIADGSGRAKGTGFVVAAIDLGLDAVAPDELLLITNAHVISLDQAAGAVPWEDAEITFEDDESRTSYHVQDVLWSSPEEDLDVTVLRTQPPLEGRPAVPVANVVPVPGARVYVIGHPQGRALSWSIYDNKLLKRGERYLHYRTPTEQGSSGSPVFNRDWKLIGLHHYGNRMIEIDGGDEPQPANEGITIGAIQARAEKPLAPVQPPEAEATGQASAEP